MRYLMSVCLKAQRAPYRTFTTASTMKKGIIS